MGMIRSRSNGLVLVLDFKYNERQLQEVLMQVNNLSTKCCRTLPKCPSNCTHEDEVCGVALGFDPSTNECKIVHIYGNGYRFEIFALGCFDNDWRTVPGPFKEPYEPPFDVETFEWGDPVSVNGRVMYWYVDTNEYFVSMNISNEKAYKMYLPKLDQEIEIGRFSFMEMGGNLSFWYQISSTQIDVRILKDLHGRNWLKIHSMMMESINYKYPNTKSSSTSNKFNPLPDFMKLVVVAALRDGEMIVFQHKSFRYNFSMEQSSVDTNGEILHWYADMNEYVVSMNMLDEKTYRIYFHDVGQEIKKSEYKLLAKRVEVIVFMHMNQKYLSGWLYFYDVRKMKPKKLNLKINSFMPYTSNSLIPW
ncbi:hypothetical protein Ddye_010574 [Dipteronia dyeriana]|uniref:F-box associated domain-containing protein n=1 Tax=Dipteronia dyeriana TaxID=168575 RepID=A0AAE0CND5_9ROSI|nr:hypothetical protein Ddye_010574 [Dipteronia dyeriana]